MEFPLSMGIRQTILLHDGKNMACMPDWAKAEVWLGWWSRQNQLNQFRLLVIAVIPSRELSAAFAGLGCLVAGAQQFCAGFTWNDLRNLPLESKISWQDSDGKRNGGIIIEPGGRSNATVWIKPTVGPKKSLDAWGISENTFSNHLFCENKLPTPKGTLAIQNALQLHNDLGLQTNPRWIRTAGSEARIVTNLTRFWRSVDTLRLATQESVPVPLEDALCASKYNDNTLGKLRVTSSNKISEQSNPVSILDGTEAFRQLSEIHTGNILLFLDRTEYSAEIHNLSLYAGNVAAEPPSEILNAIPSKLPPGMEITAFVLPKDE